MPSFTRIGALKIADPDQWESEIRAAMKAAKGRVDDAAVTLGVTSRHLFRWLSEQVLQDVPRAAYGLPKDGKRGRRAVEKPKLSTRVDTPPVFKKRVKKVA